MPSGPTKEQLEEKDLREAADDAEDKGVEAYEQGEWATAIKEFSEALEYEPDDETIRQNLVRTQEKERQAEAALRPNITANFQVPPPPLPAEWNKPDTRSFQDCIARIPPMPQGPSDKWSPACVLAQEKLYQNLQAKVRAPQDETSLRTFVWQQVWEFEYTASKLSDKPIAPFTEPDNQCAISFFAFQEAENCNRNN